jgi:hypothetical protein
VYYPEQAEECNLQGVVAGEGNCDMCENRLHSVSSEGLCDSMSLLLCSLLVCR